MFSQRLKTNLKSNKDYTIQLYISHLKHNLHTFFKNYIEHCHHINLRKNLDSNFKALIFFLTLKASILLTFPPHLASISVDFL